MRNELYKLHRSKVLYILIGILFVSIFFFSIIYNYTKNEGRYFGYGVENYSDFQVVSDRIKEDEDKIIEISKAYEDGNIDKDSYLEQIEYVTINKNIYQYILENKLEYKDGQCIQYFAENANDRVIFVVMNAFFSQLFIVVFIAIITFYVINNDFQSGTFKFVYTSGPPRRKIMIHKILTILVSYLAISFTYIGAVKLFSMPYEIHYGTLIDVVDTSVSGISSTNYISKVLFSTFLDNFYWVMIFISISLTFRNIYYVVGGYFISYAILEILFCYIPVEFISALAVQYFNIHNYNVAEEMYWIATSLKYLVFMALLGGTMHRFERKDLA